jgi:aminomethyltransferase
LCLDRKLKKTPFYQLHADAGAKFGAFAGYDMPLFYPLGIMKEHLHTREKAGLFDISHMVHVEISGPDAAAAIERACPYLASEQEIGASKYTFFLNESGGIIDDLIITRLGDQRFLIVANAGCAEKDIAHITAVAGACDAKVNVVPRAFLALQGPMAEAVLEDAGLSVSAMAFMSGKEIEGEAGEKWFVSRTGYTGEDGFEVGMPIGSGVAFAQKLLDDERVEWIGLGARDSLRLEAGLSLYGQDLSEEITPHEAGLIWAIAKPLREGGSYIGADALAAKIASGRKRKRIGLQPAERVPVRAGATLHNANGDIVGQVTSGGFGPSVGAPVALGLIEVDGDKGELFADVRGKRIAMNLASLPFAPHRYKR